MTVQLEVKKKYMESLPTGDDYLQNFCSDLAAWIISVDSHTGKFKKSKTLIKSIEKMVQ